MLVWRSQSFCVFLTLFLTALFLLSVPSTALAQAGQSELTGDVRDSSGAALAKATAEPILTYLKQWSELARYQLDLGVALQNQGFWVTSAITKF